MKKERRKAHEGYPGKDVGEPNLGEREFETGKDEAWFAKIDRDFEGFSDLLFARKHQALDVTDQLRQSYALGFAKIIENGDAMMKQYLERVNQANMQATANIDQSNDAMLTLLIETLKAKGTATITIK